MNFSIRAAVFGIAIFGSATLIFLVQPLVGKRILPWFGGAPAVWTLCLAFYQTMLFVGYSYAHGLVRFASIRIQVAIHAAVLVAASLTLPVLPGETAKPALGSAPEGEILGVLFTNVGLPFLALAATGPLVQAWFAIRYPERSPYFLYSISNIGSLLGLLGFSFFLEPRFSVSGTDGFWSVAFLACAFAVVATGVLSATNAASPIDDGTRAAALAGSEPAAMNHPTTTLDIVLWAVLPASAVILLTGLTNELTIDVASFPFLWVAMLAAYLMSFILAFASDRAYSRPLFLSLTAVLLLLIYATPFLGAMGEFAKEATQSVAVQIVLYSSLLFSVAMVLHGELYALRPPARDLTRFYLFVSGGGAVGGLFAGIVAPRVLTGFYEVFVGLVVGWLALLTVWSREKSSDTPIGSGRRALMLTGLAVGTLVIVGPQMGLIFSNVAGTEIYRERTFFGVLRIFDGLDENQNKVRILRNGITRHGYQAVEGKNRLRPTAYFGEHTGIGLALWQRSQGPPLNVGIVGLGIGTLAAYGRPVDRYRFYEIDPAVTRIARDDGYFSFVRESRAKIDIVTGDARLALAAEAEARDEKYDVLIIDAFTSDAIPVHLMTRESLAVYLDRLAPNGLLAFHISNRHFNLEPILARLVSDTGAHMVVAQSRRLLQYLSGNSKWALISHDPSALTQLQAFSQRALQMRRLPEEATTFTTYDPENADALDDVDLWTDDYTNPLGALRDDF